MAGQLVHDNGLSAVDPTIGTHYQHVIIIIHARTLRLGFAIKRAKQRVVFIIARVSGHLLEFSMASMTARRTNFGKLVTEVPSPISATGGAFTKFANLRADAHPGFYIRSAGTARATESYTGMRAACVPNLTALAPPR